MSERIRCWCGEWITEADLDSSALQSGCGGSGIVECRCGGDQCICHLHGETECPGCGDCGDDDDLDDEVAGEEMEP